MGGARRRGGEKFVNVREERSKKKTRKEKRFQVNLNMYRKCTGEGAKKRKFARKGKRETYWPFLFGWCSKGTEDGFELIHVTLSREVRRPKHQFRKNASDGPNINGGTVVATTEQQFRWPIPSRTHKHIRPVNKNLTRHAK